MRLTLAIRELHPRRTFRIARARRNAVRNVFVRVESDGVVGYGEASPNAFYNETAEGVAERLQSIVEDLKGFAPGSVAEIEQAWIHFWPKLQPSRAAQCALDLALWDWLAKRMGISATELAWGSPPRAVTTFCTIGLSTPEELAEKAAELKGYPAIKIKADNTGDLAPVRYVREHVGGRLAVDANCAWGALDLPTLSRELAALGVDFLEQPTPPESPAVFSPGTLALPVFADESCVTEADVESVAGRFSGFNIKLVKCGGITPARRMVAQGRARGCQLMVGCMLESSALIAAGAVIAQPTDYADLDGAWLLADDPFTGWNFRHGLLHPPSEEPGLGVTPAPGIFQ